MSTSSKNIVIDAGNSFTKIAIYINDQLEAYKKLQELSAEELQQVLEQYKPERAILSEVKPVQLGIVEQLQQQLKLLIFNQHTPVPIINNYKSKDTLGKDRLAAVAGAAEMFQSQNILVIDAGTCITYDFVDSEKNYEGGAISPGMQMRAKAMHHFTGQLPLVEIGDKPAVLSGKTTAESIISGVINGMTGEIETMISSYCSRNKNLIVVLTGGDASFFETLLKSKIFVIPRLVLFGLNKIINYNA